MEEVFVIKIGGNVIDNEKALSAFLRDIANLAGKKILVHGGGKLATKLAEQLQVPQQMHEGRRITDTETLKIVTMVYAGYINKSIVAQLQASCSNAIGISGGDGNLIEAHKRVNSKIDYGNVGDVDIVNVKLLEDLFRLHDTIVVAPITHDKKGNLLNTNADTIAQEIATALCKDNAVSLVYCFEKKGVLIDVADDNTVIPLVHAKMFEQLLEQKAIHSGMVPKLTNAFTAINKGVKKVLIGHSAEFEQIIKGNAGTTITQ